MSQSVVQCVTIKTIDKAKNSDRLLSVTFRENAWKVVVAHDAGYKVGDKVFYFEPDLMLLPEHVSTLGLSYLAGGYTKDGDKANNRVKSIKLRGNLSEGMILGYYTYLNLFDDDTKSQLEKFVEDGDMKSFTRMVGVIKYLSQAERNEGGSSKGKHDANLVSLPKTEGGVAVYDIERYQNYPHFLEYLMKVPCFVTVKKHGTHGGVTVDSNNKVTVFQRRFAISGEHDETNAYVGEFGTLKRIQIMQQLDLINKIRQIREWYVYLQSSQNMFDENVERVTIRLEILGPGVLGNYYKLPKNTALAFEIEVNGKPVDAELFVNTCKKFDIQTVPVLAYNDVLEEWLNCRQVEDVVEVRDPDCTDVPMEGIVIKPMKNVYDDSGERIFTKIISVDFLNTTY